MRKFALVVFVCAGPKPRRRTDGFYHTTRWRKLRRYILSREPLCRDPFGEHASGARWSRPPRWITSIRGESGRSLRLRLRICRRCASVVMAGGIFGNTLFLGHG